jgi:hypothetical protein
LPNGASATAPRSYASTEPLGSSYPTRR